MADLLNKSNLAGCLTSDVPTAGRLYFGLSRNGSYAAAERGEIPTVRVGRLLRVPIKAMEQLLEMPAGQARSRERTVSLLHSSGKQQSGGQ